MATFSRGFGVSVLRRSALLLGLSLIVCGGATAWAEGRDIGEEQSQRHLSRATEQLKKGRTKDAEGSLRKAVAADPKNIEAFKKLAVLLLKQRRYAETDALLRRGLESNPRDPQLDAYMAVYYCSIGQSRKALATFKQVEPYISQPGAMQFMVGECMLYNGDYGLAVEVLKRFLDQPRQKRGDLDYPVRLRYASALLKLGELQQAQRYISALARSNGKSTPVRGLQAELALRRGDCRRARQGFEDLSRRSQYYMLGLAEADLCLGQVEAARTTIDGYMSHRRAYLDAYLAGKKKVPDPRALRHLSRAVLVRGDILTKLRQYRAAASSYAIARQLGERDADVDEHLATMYFEAGDYRRCLGVLERTLGKQKPGRAVLRLALRAALRSNQRAQALALADRLVAAGTVSAHELYLAGVAYKSSGRYEEASEKLRQAYALAPRDVSLQRDLGHTYLLAAERRVERGDLDQAVRYLEQAHGVPAYATSSAVDLDLALLAMRQGHIQRGLDLALGVLKRNPDDRHAMRIAAYASAQLHRYNDARRWYAEYAKGGTPATAHRDERVAYEAAVVQARSGDVAGALPAIERAEAGATGDAKAEVRRNVVRAYFLLGGRGKTRRSAGQGWAMLQRAVDGASVLPEQERAALLARAFFMELAGRKLTQARQLAAAQEDTVVLGLREPLRRVGKHLISVLLQLQAPDAKHKIRAARALQSLARNVGPSELGALQEMASAVLQQSAVAEIHDGRSAVAQRLLRESSALTKTPSASLTLNIAVARYQRRATADVVADLKKASETLPVALCNLGVYEQNQGNARKAYDYFHACQQRGGQYPKLGSIVELKASIFGS